MNKLMKQKHLLIKSVVLLILSICFFPGHVYAQGVDEKEFNELIFELSIEGNIFEVRKDGLGDFTTIIDGVNSVNSNDTLIIYPGIYKENVDIQNKTVNLIGIDRDTCILMSDSTSYHKIPLNIGAGRVQNLTIYGNKTQNVSGKELTRGTYIAGDADSIYEWQDTFPGYAIHSDQDYSFGKNLHIENCRILSNNNQCVGIGCRAYNNISIVNCELVSNGVGGCIYFHNSSNGMLPGNATFLLKDCELKNYACPYVIAIHSVGDTNPVEMTFQNNRISTIAYERKGRYTSQDDSNWPDVVYFQNKNFVNELKEAGFSTSYEGELVRELSLDESQRFVQGTIGNINFLKKIPNISEGITYIKMFENTSYYINEEKTLEVKSRVRRPIQIYNMSGSQKKDGWLGLSSMYLTSQSYGNTLMEMNYPTKMGAY